MSGLWCKNSKRISVKKTRFMFLFFMSLFSMCVWQVPSHCCSAVLSFICLAFSLDLTSFPAFLMFFRQMFSSYLLIPFPVTPLLVTLSSRDAQSPEKSVFYGFISLASVYGKIMIYGRIYGFVLTRFGYYPPPHYTSEIAVCYGKKRFFDESTDFFVLSSPTTPPPPPTLDSRYFARERRANLFGCNFFGYYPENPPIGQPCSSRNLSSFILTTSCAAHFIWIFTVFRLSKPTGYQHCPSTCMIIK